MKLVIQIPCYNEADTLGLVLSSLPKSLPGIDTIEVQIIDDGSTDSTVEVAKSHGVQHIYSIPGPNRRWLGRAFQLGVDQALARGADILVNTDGDNQYPASALPLLLEPLLQARADIVIGDRSPGTVQEFSESKRVLQRLGNTIVSCLTGAECKDAVSGFRAYSRRALLQLPVLTQYTYTVDTLIQAHAKGLSIAWVPITPNPATRESRLIRNLPEKVIRSGLNILRLFTVFDPFRAFGSAALCFFLPAVFFLGRFLYYYCFVPSQAAGHIQSVVAGAAFLIIAAVLLVFGMIGELLAVNRLLIEGVLERLRKIEAEGGDARTMILRPKKEGNE